MLCGRLAAAAAGALEAAAGMDAPQGFPRQAVRGVGWGWGCGVLETLQDWGELSLLDE